MITPQAIESYPANTPLAIQQLIRDRLAADPYFAEHRVAILLQDEGEMRTLIQQKTLILKGPVLVICIAAITPMGLYDDGQGNLSQAFEFALELVCTEQVVTNRATAGFDTALGVIFHAATSLYGQEVTLEAIDHTINGEGLFQATARLRLHCH